MTRCESAEATNERVLCVVLTKRGSMQAIPHGRVAKTLMRTSDTELIPSQSAVRDTRQNSASGSAKSNRTSDHCTRSPSFSNVVGWLVLHPRPARQACNAMDPVSSMTCTKGSTSVAVTDQSSWAADAAGMDGTAA